MAESHVFHVAEEDLGGSLRRVTMWREGSGEARERTVDIMNPDVEVRGRMMPVLNAAFAELMLDLMGGDAE